MVPTDSWRRTALSVCPHSTCHHDHYGGWSWILADDGQTTGASLWTSYCTLWIQSQPCALYLSNSGTFQGSVTYPILSQLKVKHGLWQDPGKYWQDRLYLGCWQGPTMCLYSKNNRALLCGCIWGTTKPCHVTWSWNVTRPWDVRYWQVLGCDKFWLWQGTDSNSIWVSQGTECYAKQQL